MEKNKNRTDLLAAGRKKLQQFRQKKDVKGNSTKSSAKASKSGHASTAASDNATATDKFSERAGIPEILPPAGVSELPLHGSGVDKTVLNQSDGDGRDVDSGVPEKDGSSSLALDTEVNVSGASYTMIPEEKFEDSNTSLPVEFESQHGKEPEIDVGAMQEVGSSRESQIDKDMPTQIEGDGNVSSNDLSATAGENKTASGNIMAEEQMDEASLTGFATNDVKEEATEGHDHAIVTGPLTDSVVTDMQREGVLPGSSNEEKTEMLNVSEGYVEASSDFSDVERLSELTTDDTANSLECKQVDLSSVLDGNVIKLSQLAGILRILDEDEFRFLVTSRELPLEKIRDTDEIKVHDSVGRDAFERLKEQLYVTSFSKDAFHLQLLEQQTLINEISAVNASLAEVLVKNEKLAEDIAQCRYELQGVVSERDELQKQLHASKAEVVGFSSKVDELQKKLELAQDEMSSLSSELVDCRNSIEGLRADNENLNGSLKVMTEEREKLSEQNGFILLENEKMAGELTQSEASLESLQTLLRDDRRLLEEKIDSMVGENSKLHADLAKFMSTVEAFELENRNLNEILTSASEERKKLEEDKEFLVQQIDNISKESMDHKDLVATLQMEISNLNGYLTSIKEERIKLEEEIFSEYEKQSLELVESKVVEAVLQAECKKAMYDLKEAASRFNQLTEENETINADLRFHQLKLKDLDRKEYSSQFEEVANRGVDIDISMLQKPKSDGLSQEQLNLDISDDPSGFIALKRKLDDAEILMKKLEKEIEVMHLTSLNTSSDKVVAPGVSKLIKAFESKRPADDQDLGKSPLSENQTAEDTFIRTKMVAENLRILLKELIDDAENVGECCRVMQNRVLAASVTGTDRSEYDSLREHADQVEQANIELMVLYEAMREHSSHAVTKEGELLNLCDGLQKQEVDLKSENSQLREKLNDFQAKISELQSQLDGICRDSNEMVASISKQVQTLEAEVSGRESFLEEEWNSVCAQVLQAVGVLDSTIKTFWTNSLAGDSNLGIACLVAASIDGATKVIEGLHGQLEASHRERQEISDRNDMALRTLHTLYSELRELVSKATTENALADDKVLDLLHPDVFDTLLDQLKQLCGERLRLESENKLLSSDLMSRATEADELEKRCLKSDTIMKLAEDIEQSVRLEGVEIDAGEPASRLESLIYSLIRKYKEADQDVSLSTSLEMKLRELQGQVERLNLVLAQHENENFVFKQSLKSAEEDAIALNRKVQEKVAELEMSEQRVLSLREKLSIAVTKGKGLISQRDSLKQSLAEMSKELEKSSQELLSKDAWVHELETKLKVYSEAGERMESLESELSYIRNSATALRESFLLKDSVLQRIEEILEDLELPDHFHSRDIIEKIEWLAKSVGGNSSPLGDWDRRSSVGGGSYPDAGFVGVDGLKEDMQTNPYSVDDLRIRYEELQNKFYGLAEQNEMLEQSLLQRNNLVQRWEEILDRVDVPSQLRSMEPEYKIQWIGSAFSEAQNRCYSLQQKIDELEGLCGSLTVYVEDSLRRTPELVSAFQQSCVEKEILSIDLEILSHDNDDSLKKTADFKMRNENLQNEVIVLQEQKLCMGEDIRRTEDAIRRLQELVINALQDSTPKDDVLNQEGFEYFEEMLRELVEKYKTLSSGKSVNIDPNTSRDLEEQDVVTLNKKLEDSIGELTCLREERDEYMVNNQSLLHKVEELETKTKELQDLLDQEEHKSANLSKKLDDSMGELMCLREERDNYTVNNQSLLHKVEELETKKKELQDLLDQGEQKSANLSKNLGDSMGELMVLREERDKFTVNNQSLLHKVEEQETKKKEVQDLLNLEEQKSASLREKLNVAVRKGKSLVQQRDGMKQVIEELNAEVERLRSEAKHYEKAISEYEEQIKNLFTAQERLQVMESENGVLRDRLAETERYLQEKEVSWSSISDVLNEIDVGLAFDSGNPIEKLNGIGKCLHDLRTGLNSAEQEARKSKRAAELLLTELNEVQERNDGLQEELAKAVDELSEVSRERDIAENAKNVALAHVEKLSYIHSEENDRQLSEIMVLKSGVDNVREDLSAIDREMGDVLSKDLEVFHNMKAMMKSFSDLGGTPDFSAPYLDSFPGGIMSRKSENNVFMTEIGSLRERLYNHSHLLQEEVSRLSEVLMNVHREYTSQKELYESMNRDVEKLKLIEKKKESESHILLGNISHLYETCASAISEIENWKDRVAGNVSASRTPERDSKSQIRNSFSNYIQIFDEEGIRGTCEKLLLLVRDFISMQSEFMEGGQREMKSTIINLQKELEEKDVQRERICTELVNQIKEAETNVKNYSHDLQQAKTHLHDSQRQLEAMVEERKVLEQRLKELQHHETNSVDLDQKVNSLTDALAAKTQETEALMQALDEQEAEMEDLTKKIGGLENDLLQKNQDLESLEASRAKALKKLSVTVSKFDELHYFSESLLAEVEKLQSQLQERDGEISFLRQEVTRCTNDALAVTQLSKTRGSDEILGLLSWLDSLVSRVYVHDDATSDDSKSRPVDEYKEVLQMRVMDLISELENLRVVARNSDVLLQEERCKVEGFAQKEQHLKNSLREKESELVMLQGAVESAKATKSTSEIVEAEQMTNNWASPATIIPQVRSLRKSNNDQVAIAIDVDHSNDGLEDDDDKAHGFKSLTTSKIVPRFTRPVSDFVDGLWVSCDRALMRQPALRLGVIIYWALLHAMLATFAINIKRLKDVNARGCWAWYREGTVVISYNFYELAMGRASKIRAGQKFLRAAILYAQARPVDRKLVYIESQFHYRIVCNGSSLVPLNELQGRGFQTRLKWRRPSDIAPDIAINSPANPERLREYWMRIESRTNWWNLEFVTLDSSILTLNVAMECKLHRYGPDEVTLLRWIGLAEPPFPLRLVLSVCGSRLIGHGVWTSTYISRCSYDEFTELPHLEISKWFPLIE
ncbi:hypothetical protein PHJA_000306200 [Phtheirospermum japonicum]|uniref:Uncharacterized protein n=1 Tax=Phtheirospermum japonicum TaxID=374723 RepID=A0A830B8P4_9LAMI|nr:hypothetical protein PHJA_000306200 [Phtheirospermum japonicum]